MTALAPAPAPSGPLVLYDGLCGFCDASVQWTLRHDPDAVFRFAPLQGPTAQEILRRHPEVPAGIDSILLVEQRDGRETITWYSQAIFGICGELPGPWRFLAVLRILPRVLSDLGYRLFARLRYLVWGRRDTCRIPTPAERARFLP